MKCTRQGGRGRGGERSRRPLCWHASAGNLPASSSKPSSCLPYPCLPYSLPTHDTTYQDGVPDRHPGMWITVCVPPIVAFVMGV
eukprot:766825-Hanusia_phi.AAC.1